MKISPYTKRVTTILSHTAPGQELLNGRGDIQVNNAHMTLHLSHFTAFPLGMMMNQLAPVIFIS